ncbi:MAG: hypothetical protein AABZ78_01790, partial [Chloroflexota bacterium]
MPLSKLFPRKFLVFLFLLFFCFLLVLYLAPEEKTMGAGIKSVYAHVALIWTGMLGMLIAGVLGIALTIFNRQKIYAWMMRIGWVTLGVLVLSAIVSIIAQIINWNGIFWDEPRSVVQFQTLAAFIIALIASQWLPWLRVRGLVVGVTVVLILTVIRIAPLVLHPENPIGTSNSSGIQFT